MVALAPRVITENPVYTSMSVGKEIGREIPNPSWELSPSPLALTDKG